MEKKIVLLMANTPIGLDENVNFGLTIEKQEDMHYLKMELYQDPNSDLSTNITINGITKKQLIEISNMFKDAARNVN